MKQNLNALMNCLVMYNDDLEYRKVEEKFKAKASYLMDRGYIEGKELNKPAYEIYLKAKDNGSEKPE